MKKESVTTKSNTVAELETNYIEEALKLFECKDIREHLRGLISECGWEVEDFAEMVFKAPIPLEKKLTMLKLMTPNNDDERLIHDPATLGRQIIVALKGRYNGPDGAIFRVLFRISHNYEDKIYHCWREKICMTFDEAVEYIKRRKAHETEEGTWTDKEGFDSNDVYCIDKLLPRDYKSKVYLRWLLNSDGDILYYDYLSYNKSENIEIPGILRFPVPFKVGDIVVADCRPFAEEKRVLILDNNKPIDYYFSENCMYITRDGKIDSGLFKANMFLDDPLKTYVSVLYRAKKYEGELSESEAPLGIISKAIKDNPKLGQDIHKYVEKHRGCIDKVPGWGNIPKGVQWEQLEKEFSL